ncbi:MULTISPECIES: arginine N-succinyltransferase [Sphingomonas]|uniref:Arginine N-succinyltransferase n=1 Tax=Sphingomonas molluscorum TaxID=418184 RepID=A0ABU8Q8V7_9SPHN|nr:arginine N-succinyltransferase [Sphingomonas sp. JUb134]MBM7407477.1 arginine N-succinyltransferase [Sphingomonas sp. JUb134]
MLVVRPAGPADLIALKELAVLSGRGFTSLPENDDVLAERLALAEESFAGTVAPAEAWYTLMLEESDTGEVLGVAGVRAAVGLTRPHFSFRIVTLAQYSPAARTRFDHQALVLVNECGGWTEVGSLFVHPRLRGGGGGSLLARARYMLIGAEPIRFSHTVMAELRGWFDADDTSPFWEGVSSKFYRLPFEQADHMVTATDGQFILDLAPRHPIYVELIDRAASDAIGRVHRDGEAALALLEREGFERSGLVDIFDGGPTVTCARDTLATVRSGRTFRLAVGEVADAAPALLSTAAVVDFRATRAPARADGAALVIAPATADALRLREGDLIRMSA